jgi:hypothetical protein
MHRVDPRVFARQLVGLSEEVKFGWLRGSSRQDGGLEMS